MGLLSASVEMLIPDISQPSISCSSLPSVPGAFTDAWVKAPFGDGSEHWGVDKISLHSPDWLNM